MRPGTSAALLLLLGCAGGRGPAPAPTVPLPPMRTTVSCYVGSVLTGPRPGAAAPAAEPADALALEVEARLLPGTPPDDALRPIASGPVFFVNPRAEQPLRVGATPFAGGRSGAGAEATAFLADPARLPPEVADLGRLQAALPAGLTVDFTFTAASGRALHLLVSRGPALDVGLWAGEQVLLALGERPGPDGAPLVLLLPAPDGKASATLFLVLRARAAPADPAAAAAHAERLATCVGGLPPAPPSGSEAARAAALERAAHALANPFERRSALLLIATATGAGLVEALALEAEDSWLAKLAGDGVPPPAGARTGDALAGAGAELERRAFGLLADLVRQEELPGHLEACLLRRAGAAARSITALEAAAVQPSLKAIDERLVAENRSLLEDATAGMRARAFEWLTARGAAPAGFDPLAPAQERRAALDRARAEAPR